MDAIARHIDVFGQQVLGKATANPHEYRETQGLFPHIAGFALWCLFAPQPAVGTMAFIFITPTGRVFIAADGRSTVIGGSVRGYSVRGYLERCKIDWTENCVAISGGYVVELRIGLDLDALKRRVCREPGSLAKRADSADRDAQVQIRRFLSRAKLREFYAQLAWVAFDNSGLSLAINAYTLKGYTLGKPDLDVRLDRLNNAQMQGKRVVMILGSQALATARLKEKYRDSRLDEVNVPDLARELIRLEMMANETVGPPIAILEVTQDRKLIWHERGACKEKQPH